MTDLILLSGGLDSTVLLADRHRAGTARLALGVDYGQRHSRELSAARGVAELYRVPFVFVDLGGWGRLLTGSCLTDSSVPVPHDDESQAATVVPNRNSVLLMAACGVAIARDCTRVLTAVHAGDRIVYPDCRPEFIDAANYTAGLVTDERVSIEAPFSNMSKTDIVRLAVELDAPVGLTWSCYEGGVVHCGGCGACRGRAAAFAEAHVPDPTRYRAVAA